MRKWISVFVLLSFSLGLPLLGVMVGYRLAYHRLAKQPWRVHEHVRKHVEAGRQAETVAGAFGVLNGLSLDGLEKCYYTQPLDFTRVTWIGPDVPTPFVGYAPAPGPLASGSINQMQFRYGRELATPKPAGVCRIFLIGGSVAYGAGATSNGATVGGGLEHLLNEHAAELGCRFEVVTAAAGAWCSTHERILVENRLIELEPDLVISLSGFNDAHWSYVKRNVLWFRAYQDELYCALANSLLECNFQHGFPATNPGVNEPMDPAKAARRLGWNVTRTQSALRSAGADYGYALQPILARSQKPRTPREDLMARRHRGAPHIAEHYAEFQRVLADLSAPGFHYWDLTPLFDADGPDDLFIDGCHFGDRGYERIARALLELA